MARGKKFISLAEHSPALLQEWDYDKNIEYDPLKISYGSAQKVAWKCLCCGNKWDATINHRTSPRSRGCPKCAQIKRNKTKRENLVKKRGSLAQKNPKLAREWHPTKNTFTPNDITANSPERVWWQCSKDKRHEWEAPVNSRNNGAGCPICSGHRLVVGINDLATLRPDLAKQWHPTKNKKNKPSDVIAGSDKYAWWICPNDEKHEWKARINNRINGNGCPFCAGKAVLVGFNDLATVMPRLVKEWHPTKNGEVTPQSVVAGCNKKVWWKCERGHEWQAAISKRSNGTRCPECFGESKTSFPEQVIYYYFRKITTAHNRYLADKKTEIDIYLPEYKIGIEYDGSYYHRGEAAKRREQSKQEKLEQLGITLIRVREMEDTTSDHIIYSKPGANDVELAQMVNNLFDHIAYITGATFDIDVDIRRDRSEIYEQYILCEKENSLAVVNPELAEEWHPTKNGALKPEYVGIHFNKKVWWKCKAGHEWQASVNSRSKSHGCRTCYNLRRTRRKIVEKD